jgi:hypothetical protein
MACASAHQEVTVIALGTVRGNITPAIAEQIAAAPVILVALDAGTGEPPKPELVPKRSPAGSTLIATPVIGPVP